MLKNNKISMYIFKHKIINIKIIYFKTCILIQKNIILNNN